MQRTQAGLQNSFLTGIGGILWATGLLLAGSDGPYMPWLNTIGLILFVGSSVVLGKLVHPSGALVHKRADRKIIEKNERRVLFPKKSITSKNNIRFCRDNQRTGTGYALGA
jgi:hypothetical protein